MGNRGECCSGNYWRQKSKNMRLIFIIIISLATVGAYGQQYSVRDLKEGKFKNDSSYIYSLPYEEGKSYLLIQGYETKMSHKGLRALDFKMKKGSKVCAARDGVVIAVREDSRTGGLKQHHLSEGNYVFVQHNDGSHAQYWHLDPEGSLVNVGDTVYKGQVIGLSGNTGYSAFPHLHFAVIGQDHNGNYGHLATRFKTKKGIIYLRPGKFYRSME